MLFNLPVSDFDGMTDKCIIILYSQNTDRNTFFLMIFSGSLCQEFNQTQEILKSISHNRIQSNKVAGVTFWHSMKLIMSLSLFNFSVLLVPFQLPFIMQRVARFMSL